MLLKLERRSTTASALVSVADKSSVRIKNQDFSLPETRYFSSRNISKDGVVEFSHLLNKEKIK